MGTIKSLRDYMQVVYNKHEDLMNYSIEDLSRYGDYREIATMALMMDHFGHMVEELDKLETNRYNLSLLEIQHSIRFYINHINFTDGTPEVVLRVGKELLVMDNEMVKELTLEILRHVPTGFGRIQIPRDILLMKPDPSNYILHFYNVTECMVELEYGDDELHLSYFSLEDLVDGFNWYFTLGGYYDLPEDEWEEQED